MNAPSLYADSPVGFTLAAASAWPETLKARSGAFLSAKSLPSQRPFLPAILAAAAGDVTASA